MKKKKLTVYFQEEPFSLIRWVGNRLQDTDHASAMAAVLESQSNQRRSFVKAKDISLEKPQKPLQAHDEFMKAPRHPWLIGFDLALREAWKEKEDDCKEHTMKNKEMHKTSDGATYYTPINLPPVEEMDRKAIVEELDDLNWKKQVSGLFTDEWARRRQLNERLTVLREEFWARKQREQSKGPTAQYWDDDAPGGVIYE